MNVAAVVTVPAGTAKRTTRSRKPGRARCGFGASASTNAGDVDGQARHDREVAEQERNHLVEQVRVERHRGVAHGVVGALDEVGDHAVERDRELGSS
jgi:hypothetical protein